MNIEEKIRAIFEKASTEEGAAETVIQLLVGALVGVHSYLEEINSSLSKISTQLEELNKRGVVEQQLTENIGKLADRLQEYIEHKWHSVT